MPNILWEYNDLAVDQPFDMGAASLEEVTDTFDVKVSHDSRSRITECAFYITPYSGVYRGTDSPLKDYERVLWLADNYPGFGLSIRQKYEPTGEVDSSGEERIVDLDRTEEIDIFSNEEIEMISGQEIGNKLTILSYDIPNRIFNVDGNFQTNVDGESYLIQIDREEFFKSRNGSSFSSPIPLIFQGGVLNRGQSAEFTLQMRIPKFAQSAGTFYFDLNMRYTSLDRRIRL
jgi:hypothetical protein